MAKFTPAYLKKLEDLLKESAYEVRYEKGNFKSNYCLLEAKKVVVINKFSTLESRIQSLIEILTNLRFQGQIQTDLKAAGIRMPIRSTNEVDGLLFDSENSDKEVVESESVAESTSNE